MPKCSQGQFLLSLSNTRSDPSARPLQFALKQCSIIAGHRMACVPANGDEPIKLHILPDGRVFYKGERYDTFTIRTGAGKTRPLSKRQAKLSQKMRRTAEYLRWNGAYCLQCRQDQIEGEFVEVGGGKAWQRIHCLCCGKTWNDVYTLTGVLEE